MAEQKPKKKNKQGGSETKKDENYNGEDVNTRFKIGNEFWKARSSHGRKPIFKSPNDLLNACNEYLQWNADHPLYEQKVFHANGVITKTYVEKMRIATIQGMCLFLDISHQSWARFRENPDFSEVVSHIETAIYQQKIQGAAGDLMNANIVAREMGLRDKLSHELTGKDDGPIEVSTTIQEKLNEVYDKKPGA